MRRVLTDACGTHMKEDFMRRVLINVCGTYMKDQRMTS